MKNYCEERGVHSKLIYDAPSGQFAQQKIAHDFENVLKASATAEIIELPQPTLGILVASRKSRMTVTQGVQNRRTG